MDVSENSGTTKSSILIGFSSINHPIWGIPIFGNTHINCLITELLQEGEIELHAKKKQNFSFDLQKRIQRSFRWAPGWNITYSRFAKGDFSI